MQILWNYFFSKKLYKKTLQLCIVFVLLVKFKIIGFV